MALRDQPYFPLYVQDFLTDEKLMECSASATGVYIRLMCIMHKSEEYGVILLKQKDKQTDKQVENFAYKLAKFLPYSFDVIFESLTELISEGVIILDEDKLVQKRMVKDNSISIVRAEAGSKGGKNTQFAKAKPKAKRQANNKANSEYENDNNSIDINTEVSKDKTWRNDFSIYLDNCKDGYKDFVENKELMKEQERLNPGINIPLTIERGFKNYWGKEVGWKQKKKSKTNKIDWEQTIINSISNRINRVYLQK